MLWLGFGLQTAAEGVLGALVAAATLEAVFAFCLGCRIFAVLMRVGLVPSDVCEACSNIRLGAPTAHRRG